jgi:L-iditol 2-dehydrogenase
MTDLMRGVVYLGPGQLELRKVEIPKVGPDDILIKIKAATTCGTDVKTYKRGYHNLTPPSLFGHELAGDVAAVGANVTKFHVGQRVVPHNSAPCGECFHCKHDQQNLCPNLLLNWGAFAEYIVVPGKISRINVYPIPDHLDYQQASIMEPFSTVVHGHRVCPIQKGDTVAIFGSGPIGLMHLQLATSSGASKIIVTDLSDTRLSEAKKLGATDTINPGQGDPVAMIKDLTHGLGADVTIESTGVKAGWEYAFSSVRMGGRVMWFGGMPGGTMLELDTNKMHYGEITAYGIFHSTPYDVYIAYQMICSGALNTKSLVSTEMPLEHVEKALKAMIEGNVVKVAIKPELMI